jgi:DNA-binding NtrC family response regulator
MALALETLMRESFDVAIIDFCDPSCREYVAAAVQRRVNGTAVIFTCARHSGAAERMARELSPAFFFVKPIEPSDLLAVILRIVEIRNRQRLLAEQRMEKREGVRHEQAV